MQSQVFDGGGEDRTRLRRIMSSLHSPDCYTPQMSTLKNAANLIVPKNNISKSTKLVSFCEISFFSSNL